MKLGNVLSSVFLSNWCVMNHPEMWWFKIANIRLSLMILGVDWDKWGSSSAPRDVAWAPYLEHPRWCIHIAGGWYWLGVELELSVGAPGNAMQPLCVAWVSLSMATVLSEHVPSRQALMCNSSPSLCLHDASYRPMAKASLMTKTRVRVGGDYTQIWVHWGSGGHKASLP